jgi:Polysaccharide lyase
VAVVGLAVAALSTAVAVAATDSPTQVLWTGTHETGNLSEWYSGQSGAEYHSGQGYAEASREASHTGQWSAKLVMPSGADGVRMFRTKESRTGEDLLYSAWCLIPRMYDIPGGWWNIFQFKSKSEDGLKNDPFFSFNLVRRSSGYTVAVYKKPEAYNLRRHTEKVVPVGRWFELKAFLHQSSAQGGSIVVWLDGTEIIRASGLTTKYPGASQQNWSVNNYSAGVSPAPTVIYVDDASVTRAQPAS